MEFIVGLSSYILGNLRTDKLPDIAVNALVEGYDTPALRILAGLGKDLWEIEQYLGLALKEMDIKLPSKEVAGLILIKYHLQRILNNEIDQVDGIAKVNEEVLNKISSFFDSSSKYAYDYIEFSRLYALYHEYDDMTNPLVGVSDSYREKRIIDIKEEILIESAKFVNNFEKIKNKTFKNKE